MSGDPHSVQQSVERAYSAQIGGALPARDELERQLDERTHELAAVRHEMDAFIYSVSHDLRAPLRLIHAHAQMLREDMSAGAQDPQLHLDQIQRGAKQLSALIDAILTYSRVSKVELNLEPTSLHALAASTVEELQAANVGRSVDWRIHALPTVHCDRELIRQVFSILLGNALTYSAAREYARIEVGVDEAGACVYVRDNGVGFDMRYAGKLFGLFQRLHRQDEFEGLGVGLALAKRIIERHQGTIWADASAGEGATFRFTLAGML